MKKRIACCEESHYVRTTLRQTVACWGVAKR